MQIAITCNLQGQAAPDGAGDDWEEEFDKPETVEAIGSVLRELGHTVELVGDGPPMMRRLLDRPPGFVFNLAEGSGVSRSREARVPAVLEMLGIPYSGSDPLALAVTLDKDCCKRVVQSAGVRTPNWIVTDPIPGDSQRNAGSDALKKRFEKASLTYPVIVKPAYEGSSKGIRSKCLVECEADLVAVVRELVEAYRQPVLVEEFIAGDEVTVGVVGNHEPRVLGAMRIMPVESGSRFIYSLEVKRDWKRLVRYESPAPLQPSVLARIEQAARDAYGVLGCRDVSRLDFRLRDGEPYLLEVNPLPGLNPETGDIVLLARGYGISHAGLVEIIFKAACARYGLESRAKSRNPSND